MAQLSPFSRLHFKEIAYQRDSLLPGTPPMQDALLQHPGPILALAEAARKTLDSRASYAWGPTEGYRRQQSEDTLPTITARPYAGLRAVMRLIGGVLVRSSRSTASYPALRSHPTYVENG
jgi:hypothetical protein